MTHISENAAVRLWEDIVGDSGEAPSDAELREFAAALLDRANAGTLDELDEPLEDKLVPFNYYLHDGYSRDEFVEVVGDKTGLRKSVLEAAAESRPFYEVTLNCTINARTGEVTILGVEN